MTSRDEGLIYKVCSLFDCSENEEDSSSLEKKRRSRKDSDTSIRSSKMPKRTNSKKKVGFPESLSWCVMDVLAVVSFPGGETGI